MGLKLVKRMVEFLEQNSEQWFFSNDIAEWIFENYPEACDEKKAKSKAKKYPIKGDKGMIDTLAGEITANRSRIEKNPNIVIREVRHEGKKRLQFYYNDSDDTEIEQVNLSDAKNKTEASDASLIDVATPAPTGNNKPEEGLYPILREYLESGYPTVYAKHINDHISEKDQGKNGHRWRHPDLVGVERSGDDWSDGIRKCVDAYSGEKPKLKLWSFEVKNEIRKSESREYFFQAVSNSSWANYGYLVARKIHTNAMSDLYILSQLHGIGLIRLNVETPANSQIVIPAKERQEIDWNTADTLFKINDDFKDYVKNIRLFYQSDEWDDNYWKRLKETR